MKTAFQQNAPQRARGDAQQDSKKTSLRRTKILHLQDILLDETDDEHGLTMPQIIERLGEKGIGAERKAIYDDLDGLEFYGLEILRRRSSKTEYAIGTRDFQLPELLLLADAVQSSRFLTKNKSEELIKKLQKLAPKHHRKLFEKSMHVGGRIKMQNESVYYNIDTIQEAIKSKKKITFQYSSYGFKKEKILRHDEKRYLESPVGLIYKDEYYYLFTYNDEKEKFLTFRVDRMVSIRATNEPIPRLAAIKNFDVQKHAMLAFSMFEGEEVGVTLIVDKSLIGVIIDRFGSDVPIFPLDETTARVPVRIMESDLFFGWLVQFGTKINIEKPESLAAAYKQHLISIIESI